ncbi:hypothetical protein [Burkholderia cenocepacia]|uniref:hypothetical protein n=1 Tax=Burkholderia cenocepacia TaxID=95486 RepID=UPI0022390D47|nr:hypothetical protein [Burkholderia cenocepacia]MCW5156454.1 hypothetical protein [Burkholderia cenocepacia]
MDFCSNKDCSNHSGTPKDWFVKIGYYKPKTTNQKTPRYKCKSCGKSFSTHTNKSTAWQKKPEINKMLFKLLVSGVSLRRASAILDVEYNTIVKHFGYLAKQCQELHKEHLKTIKTSFVMVDEMETFLHARPKALSVPMVVRVKTGEILGFAVAKMPAKGKLAQIGVQKYAWTTDERAIKFQSMLLTLKPCFKDTITIKSDGNSSYPKWIRNQIPHAKTEQVLPSDEKIVDEQGKEFDQLFAINNTFAKMRHDMNRLARKTWSTTKAIHGLENHIWLYVAWINKYKIK